MTESAEGPDDVGMSVAIAACSSAHRHSALRLATRFPSTSGTAKHLAIGAGGYKR